jgi:hypothetical protein
MAALAREAVSRLNVELMSASDQSLVVNATFGDSNLVVKMNVDATIAFAFLLDLADSHLTDFDR